MKRTIFTDNDFRFGLLEDVTFRKDGETPIDEPYGPSDDDETFEVDEFAKTELDLSTLVDEAARKARVAEEKTAITTRYETVERKIKFPFVPLMVRG